MFWKPIICMYHTFNSRRVIFENRLTGKRRETKEWRAFGKPFSRQTDSIDQATYNHILNGGKYKRVNAIILKN